MTWRRNPLLRTALLLSILLAGGWYTAPLALLAQTTPASGIGVTVDGVYQGRATTINCDSATMVCVMDGSILNIGSIGGGGGGGASTAEPFITKIPSVTLSNEFALSTLATALLVNTTATGVPTAYAGTSCTNQFPRSLSATGVATCASVSLTGDVTGDLPLSSLVQASGASILLGRGSAGGAGDFQEITLGANLTMTGTVLSASGGGGGAPTTATYWTSTADATLSNEVNLGALTTALLVNTVSAGTATPSAYAGTTPCSAGQFMSALSASGVATCGTPSGSGNVSAAGTLTLNQLVIGQGTTAVAALGTLGSATTVLHGGTGAPVFSAVDLTADVTGDLPFANLAQGAALSVLGVAGNATADVASIVAGTDGTVLRRSGTALGFGSVNLSSSNAVTNRLPYGNLPSATAGSILVGRGSSGIGDLEEITLGANLTMTGTVLSATGVGGGGVTNVATAAPITGGPITTTGTIGIDALVNAQTGTTYTVLAGDKGKLVTHTNAAAIAVTLPQAGGAFPAGWFYDTQNRGAGTVTITPTTSTIDGAATLAVSTATGTRIFSDGTNYFTQRGQAGTTPFTGSACSIGSSVTAISGAGVVTCNPTVVRLASDVTMPSVAATYADVTGLTFTPAANKDYLIEIFVQYTADTATVGADFSVNGPASPTAIQCQIATQSGSTAVLVGSLNTSYDSNSNKAINASTTGTNMLVVQCLLRNGSTSSAFTLRHRLETGTAAVNVVKAGATLRYTLLN